jgi:hypothetical protein
MLVKLTRAESRGLMKSVVAVLDNPAFPEAPAVLALDAIRKMLPAAAPLVI